MFNTRVNQFENIVILTAPDNFIVKENGGFSFDAVSFVDKEIDLEFAVDSAEGKIKFNIDFVLYESPVINGYVSKEKNGELLTGLSMLPTETIHFHLNSEVTKTDVLYITDVTNTIVKESIANYKPQQPTNDSPWENGFGFETSASVSLHGLKSGVYYVNGQEEVYFVVRNPEKTAKVTLVLATNTQNAYSCHGGYGLYGCKGENGKVEQVKKVSYLRPQRIDTKAYGWAWDIIHLSRPFLNWVDAESAYGNSVQYITDMDLDNYEEFSDSELLVIPAHNEYWTIAGQDNFNKFIDSGKDALIAGGNIMWWHNRYSSDGNVMTVFRGSIWNDPEAEKGKETTYFHLLKDEDGESRAAYNSIGALFTYGGYDDNKWDNLQGQNPFRVIRPNAAIFDGTNIEMCGELDLSDNHELDGPIIDGFDVNGFPNVKYSLYKDLYNFEILAYTWGYRAGHTVGTIHAFQRKQDSGTVLQFASNGAAAFAFTNETHELYRKVLHNSFAMLVDGKYQFESEKLYQAELKHPMKFPYQGDKVPNIEVCPK